MVSKCRMYHNDSGDSVKNYALLILSSHVSSLPPPPPLFSLSSLSSLRPLRPLPSPPPPSLSPFSLSPPLPLSHTPLYSLSLSPLSVCGIRKDLGGVFQWQVDKICSQQKAFPKPKTQDSTVNIHIAGMFFMKLHICKP